MSHYATLKTKLDSKEGLIAALKRMKTRVNRAWTESEIEVSETAQALYGYQGDRRSQTAEIIIRRRNVGGSSNDIGFKLGPDGTWQAIISEFDSTFYNADWLAELCQNSALIKIEVEAQKKGYSVETERTKDGKLKVKVKEPLVAAMRRQAQGGKAQVRRVG